MIDLADVILQIDSLDENIKRIIKSNVLDQELFVSPYVKLKSGEAQEFIPGSG
jgi:hypothetical protein